MVERVALPAGDYSLPGFEDEISIERKSLEDFLGSITRRRDVFFKELSRLRPYRVKFLVIEDASFEDILLQRYRVAVHPNSVLGTIATIALRFGVPVLLFPTPELSADFVERVFRLFLEHIENDFKKVQLGRRES